MLSQHLIGLQFDGVLVFDVSKQPAGEREKVGTEQSHAGFVEAHD